MTLDEVLAEMTERGYELHYLRSLGLYGWEAYVIASTDTEHVSAVAHAHQRTPIAAVQVAIAKLENAPAFETFVPDFGAIDRSQASGDLLRTLGLVQPKVLGIKRLL